MNVSELAREVGIAPSAVRFYERRGILPAAPRHGNGYRRYSDDDLCRLRVVVSLRRLGLELSTAGRLAALCQAGECDVMARDLGPLIADQRTAIARTLAELDELDGHLMEVQAMLAADPVQADLCLAKGGDDDDARSRLRAGLPMPAGPGLSVLSR